MEFRVRPDRLEVAPGARRVSQQECGVREREAENVAIGKALDSSLEQPESARRLARPNQERRELECRLRALVPTAPPDFEHIEGVAAMGVGERTVLELALPCFPILVGTAARSHRGAQRESQRDLPHTRTGLPVIRFARDGDVASLASRR